MKKELLNSVALSNEFARYAEINLSCTALKLLLYLISRIQKHEIMFLNEEISFKEFREIMGISTNETVAKAAALLANQKISIKDKTYQLFEWFKVENNKIKYAFSQDMRSHLLGLTDNMTIFHLGYIYPIKSKYTIRMYLFGMSFRFMTYYNCNTKDFKKLIGVALSKSELERRALSPSLLEINNKTNLFLHMKYENGRYYFAAAEKTEKQKTKYGVDKWKEQIEETRDYGEITKELFADLDFESL